MKGARNLAAQNCREKGHARIVECHGERAKVAACYDCHIEYGIPWELSMQTSNENPQKVTHT